GAGELDARMAKIARTFSRAAADAGVSTATLAVLPFKTDKKLAEKRVNYACAEMLTNRFVEAKSFTVTERARLDEVMKEQALGLSGAVESATAANVGKLLGARLVILGSVSRLGNVYHMSTEMVNSETGEIMASDVTEVAVEIFDRDASQYVVLVPEEQSIGIYLGAGYAPVTSKTLLPVSGGGNTFTPGNGTDGFTFISVGGRYAFAKKWMADACFGLASGFDSSEPLYTFTDGSTVEEMEGSPLNGSSMIRLSLNRSTVLGKKFIMHTGVGHMWLTVRSKDDPNTDNAGVYVMAKEGVTYFTPFARLRLEWRPQTRLGISVFGTYNLVKKEYKGYSNVVGIGDNILTQQFAFPQVMMDFTLSLYF
ncbi:MAG: CsgG/HfaB family protein, partial [bacterium]